MILFKPPVISLWCLQMNENKPMDEKKKGADKPMKKYLALLIVIMMTLGLAACGTPPQDKDSTGKQNKEALQPPAQAKEKEVVLYFANKEYIQTGDEKLAKVLPEKRVVDYTGMPLEEKVVRELLAGPKNSELATGIPTGVQLLDVKMEDGTALVNFAREGLNGGSLQESLTITQITKSLGELESVKKVQFLIMGAKAETLMGHFDVSKPFPC